ncbi:cryptochrome/photolyase family protein [Mucilaginibacter corticis]|uniref:Cryptochrome/photolyase family protein n=1 Tax=Mucilaginibacter corticis TaxID=2597670 RepID=A0A556MXD4_9SPHI|nr:cryptochrome/photolyase family protein [Mucilaginibacter corticis]TSJ44590.1 cryptochrome/photolyase family protein [Mucilaginibacter corticis]
MPKTLRFILGDQLNSNYSWFKEVNPNVTYLMMEVMQEQDYVMHHIQKILGFFAAMRNFAHQLSKKGHRVIYLKLDDADNKQFIDQNIHFQLNQHQIEKFEYQLPDEYRLDEQLKELCKGLSIPFEVADTEHFLTTRYEVKDFFGDQKKYLMENFYRHMRVRLDILMDGGKPAGNRWNFDTENRKKYDNKVPLPEVLVFDQDLSTLKEMADKMGVKYFGRVNEKEFAWPLSRAKALKALDNFCENLLPHFGTYEDAMLQEHISLFHSRLSFALNTKMIAPAEVIGAVITHWQQNKATITIEQVEGYIRQVIGWREFMRGVYWAKMPGFAQMNFFNAKRKLPQWFWTGETNMNCLKKCIGQSLDFAWAHHIQRLMVIGNFALIAGLNPDEVDEWYLGVYIDAIQWVEITNTRGMSQFADGGIIASKPYAGSAAYINKMSDYCKSCHYDHKKRHGEKACPYNSLYWDFFHRNTDKLKYNPRIGMMYKLLDKFTKAELEATLLQADEYLNRLDSL